MSNRISPSSPWLLWAVTFAVFALYTFGAIVSFAGLYAIAPWLLLPPFLYWSFPLAVDLAILVYKAAEVILRNDERKTHKIKKAVAGSVIFTFVSSAGNIVHVVNANDPDPLRFWGGVLFAGMIPWAVYLAASVLTDLIVDPLPAQREVLSTEEREEQTARPYLGFMGRFAKTQNIEPQERPEPDENNEYPPINFYESDDTDAFGVNLGEKRRAEFTKEFRERMAHNTQSEPEEDEALMRMTAPDLSVQQDVQLQPFPEGWGSSNGK